jgi:hypothetical protein
MNLAILGIAAFSSSGTQADIGPPVGVPPVTIYTLNCSVPIIGNLPLSVGIFAQAPGSVQAGGSVSLHAVRAHVSIPTNLVNLALFFGITSLSGQITTLDFDATGATPSSVNLASTPISFGPVPLVENQPATFTVPVTPATVGPFTAGSSGTVTFTPGLTELTVILPISCTPTAPAALATTVIR